MSPANVVDDAARRAEFAPDSNAPFPLTEAQKEIWLAAQMGGDAAVAYNESLRLEFRGPFDVELFRAAVLQVVQRHPILLATVSADGQCQQIRPDTTIEVNLEDLSALGEGDRDRELAAMIEQETSRTFDLIAGPLLHVRIARLSPQNHVVIWTAHHIICDGWSGGLLMSELAKIYSALKRGVPAQLDPPVPFRQYALANQPDKPGAHTALAFWKEQFTSVPPPLDLPADHTRPAIRSAAAATLKRSLNVSIQRSLKQTAAQQRTTLVVLLMAAVKTFLYRLTGETEIVVGLGAAGQAITGNTCLVGHCLNLLPIYTRLNPESTFHESLNSVKKSVLDAYDHHQSTLGSILQHVNVPRSTGRPPLVQVILNVDRDLGEAKFEGLEFACDRNPKRALHFDLFLNFVDGANGLVLECDYNTDLFDEATIGRWLGHCEVLLKGITQNPSELVGKLPLLTDAECNELTFEWNRTGVEFSKDQTLHQWFERQVEQTPNSRAMTFGLVQLTFSELNRRANQVAHYLRGAGVGPDVLVGLYVERSIEAVIGILGILKAGGAYLPLDPVYPKQRLMFMLEDGNAAVLLTQSALAREVPEFKTKTICFDTDAALFDTQPDTNLPTLSLPENLAYVIYTSGSTGNPKGTLVTHHNVVRLLKGTEHWYHFNQYDVWTFFHSPAFDFSVWELWGALLYGGRVVMVPYLITRSPEEFYALLVNEGVTVLNQTPSAFNQLIQADAKLGGDKPLALRYVIFGGEALEMRTLKPWFDRHGDRKPQLVNMYGITETTVHVTYRPLSSADVGSRSVIGIPIPDLQVHILDRYQRPVPIGVAGEMYVGGAGVARGYLKRDELTRQKFLPGMPGDHLNVPLYRSGDLGRFRPNRDIEYLGRIDDQVKIRGFRIELAEIEAVLAGHDSVRQCVVVVREDIPGDKRLIAYLEVRDGSVPELSDVRAHLKKQLPDYMIPSAIVRMEKLPLTANGKIDRKALRAPADGLLAVKGEFEPPTDAIEQMLTRLWSKVLKVQRVSLHDNFFELGGHSLLAVRIISDIEKVFKKRLPLATLLQAPTVGQLADVLRRENWTPSWSSLVPIRPGGSKPPLFLIHSHGGNVLEYYPLVNQLGPDQPVYALQALGLDGRIVKGRSLEEMAAAYVEEIRSLQPQGPYFLGGFCFGGLAALEAAQQLSALGEKVALVVMLQTVHPAAASFRPEIGLLGRWRRLAARRIDLEREMLRNRGWKHVVERLRRMGQVGWARTEVKLDRAFFNSRTSNDRVSMAYVLESLGMEHDRAFEAYAPRGYRGDVLLVRAKKQLDGLSCDYDLGWKGVFQGRLDICDVPGHQQTMLSEPNLRCLSEELATRLQAIHLKLSKKTGF